MLSGLVEGVNQSRTSRCVWKMCRGIVAVSCCFPLGHSFVVSSHREKKGKKYPNETKSTTKNTCFDTND